MKYLLPSCLLLMSAPALALNIVVTNDDSYDTHNVQQLKIALEDAGHQVPVSVPCAHQSGKGGSLGSILTSVPVHKLAADIDGVLSIDDTAESPAGYCVGDTEADKAVKTFQDYKDGTPLQASAHGIYMANQMWGSNPDLLISGPNEGQNVGFAVFISGTLGAAHNAIIQGVPAIAVSAGSTPGSEADVVLHAQMVADITRDIVDQLEKKTRHGKPLLPPLTGLNVNTPNYEMLADAEYKLTNVNWYFGSSIEWSNLGTAGGYGSYYGYTEAMGLYGLNFFPGQDKSGDTDANSEGQAIANGFIAISTIDATENAPRTKVVQVARKLRELTRKHSH
ncbi:MAG: 5'/3'-nucleotidase SurE [Candidatus Thiodiazotropha sp.]